MGMRFFRTKKFMPAGVVALLRSSYKTTVSKSNGSLLQPRSSDPTFISIRQGIAMHENKLLAASRNDKHKNSDSCSQTSAGDFMTQTYLFGLSR